MSHREYLAEVRSRRDTGDLWGSTMGEWFGIASSLYVTGNEVPEHWQYRHGIASADDIRTEDLWPDVYWLDEVENVGDVAAITRVGDVLARYADLLERKGVSY